MENETDNEPQNAYVPGDDEELQPFDVREQSSHNGLLKLIGGLGFLLFLAFIVSRLFASGTRDRDQTPRITADNTPYKEEPAERGGMETPNQDKKIYDVLAGDNVEDTVKTVPVSEEPLERPKMERPKMEKPAANIIIKEKDLIKPDTKPKAQAKPKPVKPAPKPGIKNEYVVQIASLRSRAEAKAVWERLKTKMGDTLAAGYYADIKRADLGARGVYYRLRIAGIGDRERAKTVCASLKAKNQDCIVTRK